MTRTLREVLVCIAVIVIAAVVYWKSLAIPAGLYDPLGAGTMPRIICGGLIIFSIIAILQSLLRHWSASRPMRAPKAPDPSAASDRPWLAAGTFGLMFLLAIAIDRRLPYWASTSAFLFLSMLAVQRFKPSAVPMSAILAIIFGVGVTYLFGSVFSVDLP
jgi:hypothetical protein